MSLTYLNKAPGLPPQTKQETQLIVSDMLAAIRAGGEDAVRDSAAKLDHWTGEIVETSDELAAAGEQLSPTDRDVIA